MKRKILLPLIASLFTLTSCDTLKEMFNGETEEDTQEVEEPTVEKFRVTWHLSGTKTTTTTVNKGSPAVYNAKSAPKATNSDKFVFAGWSREKPSAEGQGTVEENIIVESDIDLYAIFKIKKLNAVWTWSIDGQERTLEVKDIDYGSVIEFPKTEAEPNKAADDSGTFEFIGWNFTQDATEILPEVIITENNVRIYPVFKKIYKNCVVSFYNGNNKHGQENIVYGTTLSSGYLNNMETPTKASDDYFNYTFAGWSSQRVDNDVISDASELKGIIVKSNITLYAVFTKSQHKFNVFFKDDSGNILYTLPVNNNETFTLPSNLQDVYKAPANGKAYSFKGWSTTKGSYTAIPANMKITKTTDIYTSYDEIFIGAKRFKTDSLDAKETPLHTICTYSSYRTEIQTIDGVKFLAHEKYNKTGVFHYDVEDSELSQDKMTHLCLTPNEDFDELGGYRIGMTKYTNLINLFDNSTNNLRNLSNYITHLYLYGFSYIPLGSLSFPTLTYIEISDTITMFAPCNNSNSYALNLSGKNLTIRYYGTKEKFKSLFTSTNPMRYHFNPGSFTLIAKDGKETITVS